MSNVPQSKVSNPIETAMAAFQDGRDPEAAVYGESSGKEAFSVTEPADEGKPSQYSVEDGDASEGEKGETETPSESDSSEIQLKDPVVSKNVETIAIKDPSGKKTELQIDWDNRESIKKKIHEAAGMRFFQAERDKVAKDYETFKNEVTPVKEAFSKFNSAFEANGIDGIVELLSGGTDKAKEYYASKFEKMQARASATPLELEKMDLEERLMSAQRSLEAFQKQTEESKQKLAADRETAERVKLESVIHPVFNKYRFAGQLGNTAAENKLDIAVWNEVQGELDKIGASNITEEIVEQHFQKAFDELRQTINTNVSKKASAVIANKKAKVAESLATKANNSYAPATNSDKEAFRKDMASGNLTSALTSLFSGKVRL